MALKIPLLLVQYLYQNRKLSLPGLGVFTLDKSVVLPEENDRALASMPNAVQFQNANIASADKDLIAFICEHTGKIKPLAISDLESYLNLGTEMLNIGKPFYLEGIGTITKNKAGKFDFAPGEYAVIHDPANTGQERKKSIRHERTNLAAQTSSTSRNGLKLLAILGAVLIVGIGGWLMYKKNAPAVTENAELPVAANQQAPVTDSVRYQSTAADSVKRPVDSVQSVVLNPVSAGSSAKNYKWVILATHDKEHALRRYKQLASFENKAHLYQEDSLYFKVYFQFPAQPKDTAHIKDSLRIMYAHSVTVEP